MKLGIMQPYLFPYIGYFQLINSVDKFIAYDAVNFIKKGWINRNKILLNGREFIFMVPLKDASSFNTIAQTEINDALYPEWRNKFLKTLRLSYTNAPHYQAVFDLVTSVFSETTPHTISDLASVSLVETMSYLNIKTEFIRAGEDNNNRYKEVENKQKANPELMAKDRVSAICKAEQMDAYINPIGGKELYSKEYFADQGITLNFIKSANIQYPQFGGDFVPWLSIIDVMMFNAPDKVLEMLDSYSLE